MSADFYVYEHIRNDTGAVFYVGKGKGDRAWQGCASRRNRHWNNIAKKHGHAVRIVASGLDEELSLLCEIELIDAHRKAGANLANATAGGEGASLSGERLAKRNQSIRAALARPESRAKLSASVKAARANPELRSRISAKALETNARADVKDKISAAVRKTKGAPEFKAKQSAASALGWENRLKPVLCCETRVEFRTAMLAVEWLRANGCPKASGGPISQNCSGSRKTAYGYTWRFA